MAKQFALSTSDNPWNPLTNFDEWYSFDEAYGYHSCSYLARMAQTSSYFSDDMNDTIIERAIDDICAFDLLGIVTNGSVHYRKVEEQIQGGGS